jgi:beta-phosphoglucomutase-like phosphatase (HAD superfamily)
MPQLKAVIFGAIGTIAETSDLQRQAFNAAFVDAGLDWNWDASTYRDLLKINGGQNRLRAYRDAINGAAHLNPSHTDVTDLQIAALHESKTDRYLALLENTPLHPRAGVVELSEACRREEIKLAFCTSTAIDNVRGISAALSGLLPFEQFSTVVTITDNKLPNDRIAQPKPAPDAYLYCLQQLNLKANEVIAIEDTPVSTVAAKTLGIVTIATPGETTSDQDFSVANLVVPDLRGITVTYLSSLLKDR